MRSSFVVLVLALCAVFASPAYSGSKFEELLKKMKLPYSASSDSSFKIFIDMGGEASVIFARRVSLPQATEKSPKLELMYFHAIICGERADAENPPAQLKKITEMTARLLVGRISIEPENGAIYYTSWLWGSAITETTLGLEIGLAHQLSLELKKVLCSF